MCVCVCVCVCVYVCVCERERERERVGDRQTDRQTDSKTDRQTDRETDRQTKGGIYVQNMYVYSHTAKERKWSVTAKSSSLQVLELTCTVTRPR